MKKLKLAKWLLLFFVGFITYMAIEVIATGLDHTIARQFSAPTKWASLIGFSSIWMGVTGGILLAVLSWVMSLDVTRGIPFFFRCLIGAAVITGAELVAGLILNVWLGFGIWDYSGSFLNIAGQTDAWHSLAWFLMAPGILWLNDLFLYYFYGEGLSYSVLWAYLHLLFPWERLRVIDYSAFYFSRKSMKGSPFRAFRLYTQIRG